MGSTAHQIASHLSRTAGVLALLSLTTVSALALPQDATPVPGPPLTRLVGKVINAPAIPNPRHNPYPDAVMMVELEVVEVREGPAPPRRIMVGLWGFKGRELEPAAELAPGDRIALTVIPFIDADEEIQAVQRISSVEDPELREYWALGFEKVLADP